MTGILKHFTAKTAILQKFRFYLVFGLFIFFFLQNCSAQKDNFCEPGSNAFFKSLWTKAVFGDISSHCGVNFANIPTRRITLNKTSTVLQKFTMDQLTASISSDGRQEQTANYLWSSSDTSVVTVSATGMLNAVSVGTATITVRESGGTASQTCKVRVYAGYLITTLTGVSQVAKLTINTNTGFLTGAATYPVGTTPTGVAADPLGRFAYIGNFGSDSISQYTIDPTTGNLSGLVTTGTGAGSTPRNISISPNGKFLYQAAQGATSVIAYSINQSNGNLTLINSYNVGSGIYHTAIDPSGKYLIVAYPNGNTIASFAIDSSGALSLASQGPVISGSADHISFHPDGNYFYVLSGGVNKVTALKLDLTNGSMTVQGSLTISNTGQNGSAVHPNGKFLYTANNGTNTITILSINQNDGTLSLISNMATSGASLLYIAIDPTGRFAYISEGAGLMQQYSIDQNTGLLTLLGLISPGNNQWNLFIF